MPSRHTNQLLPTPSLHLASTVSASGEPEDMGSFYMENTSIIAHSLYLGSWHIALEKETLKEMQVTHIVTCTEQLPLFPLHFQYLSFNFQYDWPSKLDAMIQFVHQGVLSHGKVLFCSDKCNSRASTLLAAYLIRVKGVSLYDAWVTIREKRFIANFHPSALPLLLEWDIASINSKQHAIYYTCCCGSVQFQLDRPSDNIKECGCQGVIHDC
jgi:hypothetical protein